MLLDTAWDGDAAKTKVMAVGSHAMCLPQIMPMFGVLSVVDFSYLTTTVVPLI